MPPLESLVARIQLVRESFLYKTNNGVYIALSATADRQAKAQLRGRVVGLSRSA